MDYSGTQAGPLLDRPVWDMPAQRHLTCSSTWQDRRCAGGFASYSTLIRLLSPFSTHCVNGNHDFHESLRQDFYFEGVFFLLSMGVCKGRASHGITKSQYLFTREGRWHSSAVSDLCAVPYILKCHKLRFISPSAFKLKQGLHDSPVFTSVSKQYRKPGVTVPLRFPPAHLPRDIFAF